MIFFCLKKNGFCGILGPPYYGIGATIRIGWEMLRLPFFHLVLEVRKSYKKNIGVVRLNSALSASLLLCGPSFSSCEGALERKI